MSTLVTNYESSDDELPPGPSTATLSQPSKSALTRPSTSSLSRPAEVPLPRPSSTALPPLGPEYSFQRPDFIDDAEDDKHLQEQAGKDAFGLANELWEKNENGTRREEPRTVMAAPDVLKEVSGK